MRKLFSTGSGWERGIQEGKWPQPPREGHSGFEKPHDLTVESCCSQAAESQLKSEELNYTVPASGHAEAPK